MLLQNKSRFFFFFQRGEKMTREEVNAIINLTDVNADGKFDYIKVHNLTLM